VSTIHPPATIGSTPNTEQTSEQVEINNDVADRKTTINIAIVGKYVTHEDAYLSIAKVRNRGNIIFSIVAVVVDPN
jgi:CTP synthase (UTP-ammonia lyase)